MCGRLVEKRDDLAHELLVIGVSARGRASGRCRVLVSGGARGKKYRGGAGTSTVGMQEPERDFGSG